MEEPQVKAEPQVAAAPQVKVEPQLAAKPTVKAEPPVATKPQVTAGPQDAIVDRWFGDHFPGSVVARDVEVFNYVYRAVEELKNRLRAAPVRE